MLQKTGKEGSLSLMHLPSLIRMHFLVVVPEPEMLFWSLSWWHCHQRRSWYERIAMTKRVCACLEYSNGRFNQCQNRETIGELTERSIINAQWFNVRISRAQQSKPKINQLPALALKTSLFLAMNFYGISSYCLMRRCSARCNRES